MQSFTTHALRLTALALALAFAPLQAQPAAPAAPAASPLASELQAFLVVPATDTAPETLRPVEKVEPGQIVEYKLTYTNRSDAPLRTIGIDGPVPAEVVFVADSARQPEGQPVLYSVDGGITFSAPPVKYKKQLADGSIVDAIATPDQYNRLRWVVPVLAPGASIELVYRVRVR
jgi:uncharacterized repeat protein (TIGR01451 family)